MGIVMRPAPWPDFSGQPIHEHDVLQHPSGERGTVVIDESATRSVDRWRVDYGDGYLSRLCLQIGDKGRAVVVAPAVAPLDETTTPGV